MRHYFRSHLKPDQVLAIADSFFPSIQENPQSSSHHGREFAGPLGALKVSVKMEGGHYTFVQIDTDQTGESRLDRNAKKFYVELHRAEDPEYKLTASY
ncbi:MAG: hypothetical protein ABI338_09075 [Gemmatimonadaceae bacterium]